MMDDSTKYGSISTEEKSIDIWKRICRREKDDYLMSQFSIASILSTSFTYGCIMTTLFILTLPVECQRIEVESTNYHPYTIRKSTALGAFAAIAGLTQLITPVLGMMSDNYKPNSSLQTWGKRLPYLIFGTLLVVIGMAGQFYASDPIHQLEVVSVDDLTPKTAILGGSWLEYTAYFTLSMIGLNIVRTVMVPLIPDLVPQSQTGIANGAMALTFLCGSLFGFGMFYTVLKENILGMYKMYGILSLVTASLTFVHVCEREAFLQQRLEQDTTPEENISICDIPPLMVSLFYEPIKGKTQSELLAAYWIDISEHHDFFVVTISRLFYFLAISSQTFFLYFIHDALKQTADPKATAALLVMIGQTAGAVTCYPIGIISDRYFGSRRKPFVFFACFCLGVGNIGLLRCTTLRQMIGVCSLLGAANGIYVTMDTSLAVDTLKVNDNEKEEKGMKRNDDSDEEILGGKSNEVHDGAAQLLGVWGVFGFLGNAMGPLIGGITLLLLGKKDADPTQFYSMKGYYGLYSLSAFYFLCSSVFLMFVRKKGV